MDLTLAAEYLLLALDDTKGKFLTDSTTIDCAVTGAVLIDLIAAGALTVSHEDKPGKQKLAMGPATPSDPTLVEARDRAEGKKFEAAMHALNGWTSFRNRAKSLRQHELNRLVDAGVLAEQHAKIMGLFPVQRYPSLNPTVESGLRARVEGVLSAGRQPDERTGTLIALLHATDITHRVFPNLDKREVKQRAREICEGDWAAAEVKKAVENVMGAIAAIAVIGAAGAAGSS